MTPGEKIYREGLERIAKHPGESAYDSRVMKQIARETLAKAEALPDPGPFDVERDEHGHAAWIRESGVVVLWLVPGTERGEQHVDRIVDILNSKADAAPKDESVHEAVKHEREFLQDILIVAQKNDGYLPGHQMRSIKDWLEQPLPL